jgi:hypothetical protein
MTDIKRLYAYKIKPLMFDMKSCGDKIKCKIDTPFGCYEISEDKFMFSPLTWMRKYQNFNDAKNAAEKDYTERVLRLIVPIKTTYTNTEALIAELEVMKKDIIYGSVSNPIQILNAYNIAIDEVIEKLKGK